ncbi:MAG: hypothetical protein J6U23_05645 [Clostridiales bacterium]|nr:hypothetical protein [Clostridiales bacterium]
MTKWFEEVFLPSFDTKLSDPRYPNRALISERQADVFRKYMKYDRALGYKYKIGSKEYSLEFAGRYSFLRLYDHSREIWAIRSKKTNEDIISFSKEEDMQKWIDENVDPVTGAIKNNETLVSWSKWFTRFRVKMPSEA